MTDSWVLVLDPPTGEGGGARRVGGLPLALRLALDAQAAGARGVVLAPTARDLARALVDPRLRIPVLERHAEGLLAVRVPASWLVHRQLFKALVASLSPHEDGNDDNGGNSPAEWNLAQTPFSLDVPFAFDPIDVVDGPSAQRAERALFRSLRKPQDGWTSRWLNRYISLSISRLLVRTPLTPNQVSVGILAVGLYGAWLVSRGTYTTMALGAGLFQLQSILDGCDGEMSRVTHRGSLAGEWFDTVGDDLTNYSFFAGAAWGLYTSAGQLAYLIAGIVTVVCGLIASGIEYRYLIKIGSGDLLKYPLSAGTSSEASGGLLSAIQPLFKRDTFVFLTFLAALAGALGPMLVLFSLAAVGIVVSVLMAEARMARERRRDHREGAS